MQLLIGDIEACYPPHSINVKKDPHTPSDSLLLVLDPEPDELDSSSDCSELLLLLALRREAFWSADSTSESPAVGCG